MCFSIPKKVIKISDTYITVENRDKSQEQARTLIDITIGDFVIVENSIIIEKIKNEKIDELFKILEG